MNLQNPGQGKFDSGSLNTAIIVGIVRDIESSIQQDYERFTKAFSRFDRVDFYLVESGSSDSSIKKLEQLSSENSNFLFIHLEIDRTSGRTSNMANARNTYLEYLRKDFKYSEYDYVVIADFNNLNKKLDRPAVDSCWENTIWDVVTANQSGRYYDVWALRHPLWSPNDCWEVAAFYRKFIKFPEVALSYALRARSLRIPKNADWIEVDSAFGGLAIYKSDLFNSKALYRGLNLEGNAVCEHVPFHNQIREDGAKLYVNPRMINARITDHTRRLSFLFTILRIARYPFKLLTKRTSIN